MSRTFFWRYGLLFLLLALIGAFPFLGGGMDANQHDFYMQKLASVMILGMLAMSLDLLVGIVGLVSLGHAGFFGLGAYMLVMLSPQYEAAEIAWTLPAALAGVAVAAALIGALAIRTSGVYFIMVTLAVGQMFFYLFNDSKIAGGSDGAYLFVKPALTVGGVTLLNLDDKLQFFYVTMGCLVGSYLLLRVMMASPFGKVIRGIGVNEHRTRGLGYNVYFYKLAAFVIAAMVAGLAGYLSAVQYGFVNPSMMGFHTSGNALVTVILGGMGTLLGPILGAFVIEFLRHFLESQTEHWLLPFGGLIILMVLTLPRGLMGLIEKLAPKAATMAETPPDVPAKAEEADA